MGYVKRRKTNLKQSYRDSADKSYELLKSIGNSRANAPDNFVTYLTHMLDFSLSTPKFCPLLRFSDANVWRRTQTIRLFIGTLLKPTNILKCMSGVTN